MNLCCLLTNKNSIMIINKKYIFNNSIIQFNISYTFESFIKLTNLIDFILMDLSNFLARA